MKNNKATITEHEIQAALERFKSRGGLIRKLPDEIVPAHNLVGAKFAMYETVQEASSASVPEAS